jgi:hypothetical protein
MGNGPVSGGGFARYGALWWARSLAADLGRWAVVPQIDGVERSRASPLQASLRNDHEQYAGIDVSLECSSVCVADASGKILREAKVASEPEALIAWFYAF